MIAMSAQDVLLEHIETIKTLRNKIEGRITYLQ